MNNAQKLHSARLAHNLRLRELAHRAGTSASTLHKYETEKLIPRTETFNRLLQASTGRNPRRWVSLQEASSAMLEEKQAGNMRVLWGIICEMIDDEKTASPESTTFFVSARPEETGDVQLDALVQAFAEWVCLQKGIAFPSWLYGPREALPWLWYPDEEMYRAVALRDSPPSFASRGIFIPDGALERT